jgi:hypothetical protein
MPNANMPAHSESAPIALVSVLLPPGTGNIPNAETAVSSPAAKAIPLNFLIIHPFIVCLLKL